MIDEEALLNDVGSNGGNEKLTWRQWSQDSFALPKTRAEWIQYCVAGVVTIVLVFQFTAAFTTPFCDTLFRCGCSWVWTTGVSECNIYFDEAPDCPWCVAPGYSKWIPTTGTALMMIGAVAATDAYLRGTRGSQEGIWGAKAVGWRVGAAVSMFFVFNIINSLGFKLVTGYPYWLFWVDSGAQPPYFWEEDSS